MGRAHHSHVLRVNPTLRGSDRGMGGRCVDDPRAQGPSGWPRGMLLAIQTGVSRSYVPGLRSESHRGSIGLARYAACQMATVDHWLNAREQAFVIWTR